MTRREFFQRRIPRYRKDPLLFFKEVTHFEPDPWQREAAVAVSQHRRVAIRSGQGVGKTALEANLMWWFIACFSYPRIVCTAPTMQQLDNVLWAEMAKWLDASPVLQMMFTWTKTRVYMNGYDRRWFAVPRTATKPESLQGFHEDNMLFVVDEASGVADPILDAIGGTLTGANNRLLYCGNPTKATGGFAESFQGDGMDWYCMTVSSRDSPRTSKENIAALEKKYGKNSNVVRVRVDGLPPVADSDVFIPSYIAEKATMNEPLPHDSPVRLSIGCDVARFGDDCTVIAPNIDADVQELKIRNGQDLWATAEDIIFEYLFLLEKPCQPQTHGQQERQHVGPAALRRGRMANITVLALDPQTGDLCFDANGMLMLREDAEAIAQNVRNNLLTWKGEFPLNTDHGTDWERVVQQPRSEAVDEADSVVRSSIFQEPYVQEISSLSTTADGRALGVEFSGVLYNGETIRVEVNTGG